MEIKNQTVNYYEHHLGDYAEATSHLSFVEDAAYSRCIRKYYATESPLPRDLQTVQRLVGARSKEEKAAVESVLREFFVLQTDGWHNRRCDAEIARFRDKSSKARRSAESRWGSQREQSDGNANAMRTYSEGNANGVLEGRESHEGGNALQSPVSSLQSPESPLPPKGEVLQVFEHWKSVWRHPTAKLDKKRRARIEARLKDFTAEQLCNAISGFRNSPWHCGTDPKGDGVVYDGIQTLLRDSDQVEKGIGLFTKPPSSATDRSAPRQLKDAFEVSNGRR